LVVSLAREQADQSTFAITVRYTGAGIDAVDLPHVFDAFYQADPGHGGKVQGVGLGLAIVRQLVERHGGTVAVASEGKGRGCTFTVRLPASPGAGAIAAAVGATPVQG
jgi:signal transduction histidine kinase